MKFLCQISKTFSNKNALKWFLNIKIKRVVAQKKGGKILYRYI